MGNDIAIKAYREGKLPYPDGSIIAALHYKNVPSDENNEVFGKVQSFVPGAPTNIQFMVKDSTKYAATGGWGFGHFQDGKPGDAAFMKSCFPCHEKAKATDLALLVTHLDAENQSRKERDVAPPDRRVLSATLLSPAIAHSAGIVAEENRLHGK